MNINYHFFLLKNLEIEKKINQVSVCGDISLKKIFPIKSLVHSSIYQALSRNSCNCQEDRKLHVTIMLRLFPGIKAELFSNASLVCLK